MAKMMIDCANPNDLTSVAEAVESVVGRCNVTYHKQATQMVEKGTAKSIRDASRKIAADTGETPQAVRDKVRRGKERVVQPAPKPPTPGPDKGSGGNKKNKGLTMAGTPRKRAPGAGRKPEIVSDAMSFAIMAISQLERIPLDDRQCAEALDMVVRWCNRRKCNKKEENQNGNT